MTRKLTMALALALALGLSMGACVAGGSMRVDPAERSAAPPPLSSTQELRDQVMSRIAAVPGAQVGVAFVNLGVPGDTLYVNADAVMHAASTMKLPVMMRLYREQDAGKLDLSERVKLANDFTSIVDGSHYALDPGVDSDSAMYRAVGDSVTVADLIRHMITRSSNLATNTLIALANPDSVNAMMRSMGAERMRVLRGVEDQKAFDRGLNNVATARDLATLLRAIQQGSAGSQSADSAMLDVLLSQQFNEKIPAGLPRGVRVAHKTGDITGVAHDAAIVYPPATAPYVLVVLTRNIPRQPVADSLIADISRTVYGHVMGEHAVRAR